VKDIFAKKFLVPGEIPLAARSHRFFGNILLKAGHLMRSGVVVSGTVPPCTDSKTARPTYKISPGTMLNIMTERIPHRTYVGTDFGPNAPGSRFFSGA